MMISFKINVSQFPHLEERMLCTRETDRTVSTWGCFSILDWETVEGILTHGAYKHTN